MARCRYRRIRARGLVLSASLVLAACSGVATTTASSPTARPSSGSAGITSIDASVLGGGNYPGFIVKAPAPWFADGHFVMNHTGGGVLGLSVWDVGKVPRNPCHPMGNLYDPGATVDDLVGALATQPMRNATTPTDVRLGGYPARYLEWSVPAHMVVTGDADFAGCDVHPNGQRDFVSWFGNGGGERYQQVAGQVDRLWVLNVNGQRLLVDATYSPNTTQAERDELGKITKSLRFVRSATQ